MDTLNQLLATSSKYKPPKPRKKTVRAALCRDGHYFGVRPIKLPSRFLAWPAEGIERLLRGEETAS